MFFFFSYAISYFVPTFSVVLSIQESTGMWEVAVYGRKHTLVLSTEIEEDANIWSSEIQTVIDNQPQIVTKTKQYIQLFKVNTCYTILYEIFN